MKNALYALVVSSLLAVPTVHATGVLSPARTNLLVAGDFEGITTANLTAYAATSTGVWATESAAISGAANGITPLGSHMLQLNHAGGGTAAQTNQVVYGPFKAGSVVTFSAKFNTWRAADGSSPQTVAVSIMTDSGIELTGTRYTSPTVALDTNTSTWQTASVTVTLPSDTNYLSAEILLWMYSGALPYGTPLAYCDDAVLTVAPHINWVNWTGSVAESGVTKYVGHMVVPRTGGGTTTVNVKYTPPGGIAFPQFSNGTDFFAQGGSGSLGRLPNTSPYTSDKVGNIPDGGGAASDLGDIIALQYAGTNKLEFTDASTNQPIAIASPVFAYVSLNGNGYGFNQDFDILSFDDGVTRDQGYFGAGSSYKNVAVVGGATQYQLLQAQNPLGAGEPHGALQFRGAFSTVTWQSLSNEYWNGFTIGVAQLAADVPIANAGPDQTVTATSASGASVQLSGSVSGSTNAPFTYTWSGDFGTATGQTPTVNLAVGTHTITLTVTDAAGASDSDTVDITVVLPSAPVITSATSASGVYGSPFTYTITATNSPTSFGAVGTLPAGLTLSGAVISGTPASTGTFNVQLSATNLGGTGTKTLSIAIAKANATVTVNGYTGVYDGAAHGATGSATGVNRDDLSAGLSLGASFTDVPGGTANWTFHDPAGNYNDASGTAAIVITKATATVTVNGYTGTYDGAAHGATGSATGVNRDDLSRGLNLGASFTNAPGGTANWTFSGGTNYNDASGTAAIIINKATATVTVNGYTGIYDGAAHGATGSATGVTRDDLSAGLNLGASFTNAPGGTANWTFSGGTNYNDASGTAAITINKATAQVVVTPYSVTYDGQAHSATVASITGVNGESGATVGAVTLNTTHTDAGNYTSDSWSLTGGGNYNDIAATTITDAIAKADATVVVTPYAVTYDGNAHTATVASITGVNRESGATVGTVTLNTTHTGAGTYATDSWSFTGGANYNDIAATTLTDSIAKATAAVVVTPYTVTYDAQAHSATVASITGVNGETGAVVGTVTLNTTHTNAGTYATDSWSFTGAANYNDIAVTTLTDTINKANAAVTVNGYTGTYDGAAHGASGSATGVGGVDLSAGLNLGAKFTNVPGGTASWTFAGGTNYNDASGTAAIVINRANATVQVVPYTVTYDGNSHSATVRSIVGVNGETGATVGTVTLNSTHTGASIYATDSWSFTGANYNAIPATTITDTINKANATVVVAPYSVLYDGLAHSATVTSITGVNGETGATVGTVTLNSTHTYSGTYATDSWSFAGANYTSMSATITDKITPVIASVAPSTGTLWPPNHQMVAVTVKVGTSGDAGVAGYVVTATSSEPDNGLGDGDTPNDIQITGSGTLNPVINLRAERSGTGNGRTYTITVRAVDAAGDLSAPVTTTVFVPKSQGGK